MILKLRFISHAGHQSLKNNEFMTTAPSSIHYINFEFLLVECLIINIYALTYGFCYNPPVAYALSTKYIFQPYKRANLFLSTCFVIIFILPYTSPSHTTSCVVGVFLDNFYDFSHFLSKSIFTMCVTIDKRQKCAKHSIATKNFHFSL